jgi:hypothetical protein
VACGGGASGQPVTADRSCPPAANGSLRLDEHARTVRGVRLGQFRPEVARRFRKMPHQWSTSSLAPLGTCRTAPPLGAF